MSNPFSKFFSGLCACALIWNMGVSTCLSHPNHTVQIGASDSVLHYFVQPEHALLLVVFAFAMWWISRTVSTLLKARVPAKKIVQIENRRFG